MARTASFYTDRATAAFAAGFSTKTAKQDALASLNSAYELLRTQITQLCLDVIHADAETPAAVNDLYWAIPHNLHQFRSKQGQQAVAVFPQAAEIVAQIEALVALRASMKDAEIVAKVKADPSSPEVLATATRTQLRGICQCCGREQAVVNGSMSKHGYTVENGWFNGVCPGERYAPMQVSRDQADATVEAVRNEVAALQVRASKLAARKADPKTVAKPGEFVRRGQQPTMVEFAALSTFQQHDVIVSMVWNCEQRAKMGTAFANDLEALANRVHGTALKTVKVA